MNSSTYTMSDATTAKGLLASLGSALTIALATAGVVTALHGAFAPMTALAEEREVMAYSYDAAGAATPYYTTDDAISAGYEGKTIYLDCDWMFTGTMTVADSKSLTINMNGHKITSQGGGSVIRMYEGSDLTLEGGSTCSMAYTGYDSAERKEISCTVDAGGLITGGHDSSDAGGIRMDAGSHLTLDNVAVAGNLGGEAGGVYVKGECTIDMNNGASIEHNRGDAGGVYVNNQDVNINMDNASISYNYACLYGGGVYSNADATRIVMENNSAIDGNTAREGGGVCFFYSFYNLVSNDGTGSVSNNKATEYGGGGICVNKSDYQENQGEIRGLNICGNSTVSKGGGIAAEQNYVRVSYCKISGNSAGNDGGGIYFARNNCSITGCTITSNVCSTRYETREGGGVFVASDDDSTWGRSSSNLLNLSGKCIIKGNTRSSDGSADDLFLSQASALRAYIVGGVDEGSSVGVRCSSEDDKQVGKDLITYVEGTYYSDLSGYVVGRESSGDLMQRNIAA